MRREISAVKFCALLAVGMIILASRSMQGLAQSAGDELGLSIQPAILEIAGEPGTTQTVNIDITSTSSSPVGITVGARSILPNDPEIDQQKRANFDASGWIVPVEKDLILEPGESATTTIQVVVPSAASPGGHYALVTYQPVAFEQTGDDGTRVVSRPEITSFVLITTPGDIRELAQGRVKDSPKIILNTPSIFTFELFNEGNVHIIPRIEGEVIDHTGESVGVLTHQPQLSLPNTIKEFEGSWNPAGSWGFHHLEYSISFGTPTKTVRFESGRFFVLPPTTTLVFAASIVVVAVLGLFKLRRPLVNRLPRRRKHYYHRKPSKKSRLERHVHISRTPTTKTSHTAPRPKSSARKIDTMSASTSPPDKSIKPRRTKIKVRKD